MLIVITLLIILVINGIYFNPYSKMQRRLKKQSKINTDRNKL